MLTSGPLELPDTGFLGKQRPRVNEKVLPPRARATLHFINQFINKSLQHGIILPPTLPEI